MLWLVSFQPVQLSTFRAARAARARAVRLGSVWGTLFAFTAVFISE